jgi:hypothetical protein
VRCVQEATTLQEAPSHHGLLGSSAAALEMSAAAGGLASSVQLASAAAAHSLRVRIPHTLAAPHTPPQRKPHITAACCNAQRQRTCARSCSTAVAC